MPKNTKKSLTIVIFGATGNLTAIKLFPALYQLYKNFKDSINLRIYGFARRNWSDSILREVAQKSIAQENFYDYEFLENIHYIQSSFDMNAGYETLLKLITPNEKTIFYFSIDPHSYFTVLGQMKKYNFSSFYTDKRLIVEKPFGTDALTALDLENRLKESFTEESIYSIDHYLGKQMVQNLFYWRLKNPQLSSVWNNTHIQSIEVILDESIGVESRATFYDQTGALRDMIQNHALQILSMITIDSASNNSCDLSQKKVEFLKSLYIQNEYTDILRAQYQDYSNLIPSKETHTETFIAIKLFSKLPQWKNIAFYLKTGKALSHKKSMVIIHTFSKLEKIHLYIPLTSSPSYTTFSPRRPEFLAKKNPETFYEKGEPLPKIILGDYASLLWECFSDNKSHFVSSQEIQASWIIADKIRSFFPLIPLLNYPKDSIGPKEISFFLPSLKEKNIHV